MTIPNSDKSPNPYPTDKQPAPNSKLLLTKASDAEIETLQCLEEDRFPVFVEGVEYGENDEGELFLHQHSWLLDDALTNSGGRARSLILDTVQSFVGDGTNTHNNSSNRRIGARSEPILLRRSPVWLQEELLAWLRAGAPNRDVWSKMRRGH